MISCLAALAITFGQTSGGDYFPLKAGLTWDYSIITGEGPTLSNHQIQKALAPVTVVGEQVTPLQVWLNDTLDSTAYYAAKNGFIYLVALNAKEKLPVPIPVLPVRPTVGQKWDFAGRSQMFGTGVDTVVHSKVVGTEKRKILSEDRSALHVETETTMGSGKAAFVIQTNEYYVAGIGLVYRKQQMMTKGGITAIFSLVKFEAAIP